MKHVNVSQTCFAVLLAIFVFAGTGSAVYAGGASSVSAAPPSVAGAVSDVGESECSGLQCSQWLRDQHRKVLLSLLKSYYVMSVGGAGGDPTQAELMSQLTARAVATN
mgnify:FL=1|jgi:hypothetical protein